MFVSTEHDKHNTRPKKKEESRSLRVMTLNEKAISLAGDTTTVSSMTAPSVFLNSVESKKIGTSFGMQLVPSKSKLYGRDKEKKLLQSLFAKISKPSAPSHTVTVHGVSGTGKSRLLESLRHHVTCRDGYFVSAKFDQLQKLDTFGPAVAVFTDLCDLIAQSPDFTPTSQQSLREAIGSDSSALSRVFHNLHRVTGVTNDIDGVTKNFSQFKLSCRRLLRHLSSSSHPIVIFLDDLQWAADLQSLELIHSLTSDTESKNVLFFLAYRDGDKSTRSVRGIFGKREGRQTDIELKDLNVEDTNALIADTLNVDKEATLELAKVVLKKTHGLPLAVVQFLGMLNADGFLYFDSYRWEWDIRRIERHTNVSDNVADLIAQKTKRSHPAVQYMLQVASCIGYEFDRIMLKAVMIQQGKGELEPEAIGKKVQKCLYQAVKDGLVEGTHHEGRYRFSHDKIQSVLYNDIPRGRDRDDLHYQIGMYLLYRWKKLGNKEEWSVFEAANQLIKGSPMITANEEKIRLVEVTTEAARIARRKSALRSAVQFLEDGLSSVDDNYLWNHHYELAVQAYSLKVELMYNVGDFDACEKMAKKVLQRTLVPYDRVRACCALIDALDAQGRGDEAVDVGVDYLTSVGEKFPRKPSSIRCIVKLARIQKRLESYSDDELVNLPVISDVRLKTLELISIFGSISPMAGNELVSLMSILRVVEMSLDHGVAPLTTHAYASYGMAQAMVGRPNDAFRFGSVAMRMLQRFNAPPHLRAHTLAVVHGACLHWKHPFRDSMAPLLKAYEDGMVLGDCKFSFIAAFNYLLDAWCSGVNLVQVEEDMRTFCEGLDGMIKNQCAFKLIVLPYWQMVMNLHGPCGIPHILTGEAMQEDAFVRQFQNSRFIGGMISLKQARLPLAFHFGRLNFAIRCINDLRKDFRLVIYHFNSYQLDLFACLTYFELSKKKRKLRKKGLKILRRLEGWMEDLGNVNCRPIVALLRADFAALTTKDIGAVKAQFEVAILEAFSCELPNMEALANERAAVFCREKKSLRDARSYIQRSIELYQQWGAQSKVQYLQGLWRLVLRTDSSSVPVKSVSLRPSIH